MIKVFQKNKNGKVELSIKELESILNEAYWDGYRANNTYTYTTPYYNYTSPFTVTTNGSIVSNINDSNKPLTDDNIKITC